MPNSPAMRTALLNARARIDSASMRLSGLEEELDQVDPVILNGIRQAARALKFLSEFSFFDGQNNIALATALIDSDFDEIIFSSMRLHELTSAASTSDADETSNDLRLLLGGISKLIERLVENYKWPEGMQQQIETQYVTIQSAYENYSLLSRVTGAAKTATEAADSAAESAGETAQHSLSDEFQELAAAEKKTADQFRQLTVALFAGVIAYTAFIAFNESSAPTLEVGRKLALGIPVLFLAGYFGRESSQHRRVARWASVLVAQLKSVRAYSIELPDDARNLLRSEFGRRVFLESPDATTTPGPAAETADVAAILREAADLSRASRGS